MIHSEALERECSKDPFVTNARHISRERPDQAQRLDVRLEQELFSEKWFVEMESEITRFRTPDKYEQGENARGYPRFHPAVKPWKKRFVVADY